MRAAIDPDALRHYDRVLKLRGSALAEAVDHKCSACQVMLRPQTYNEVRTGTQVVICDSCQRILYFNAANELVEDRSIRGRPRVLYGPAAAVPRILEEADAGYGTGTGQAGYRELAGLLARQLAEMADVPDEAMRAGRRWAAALYERPLPARRLSAGEATAAVTDLLGRLGFDPEPDPDANQILLHRCPFAEVARENRAVICGIHLGMLTATVERLNAPLGVEGLDPFVTDEPSLCIARLATRARSRKRGR